MIQQYKAIEGIFNPESKKYVNGGKKIKANYCL